MKIFIFFVTFFILLDGAFSVTLKKSPKRSPSQTSNNVQELIKLVGFVPGNYEADSTAAESCPFGAARFREAGGVVSFMVDEQVLIFDVKKGTHRGNSRSGVCFVEYTVTQEGKSLVSKRSENCKTDKFKYMNQVIFSDNSILYKVETHKNGISNINMSCRLERKP